MDKIAKRLKDYIEAHPFDPGGSDCETILDQLYQAYAESHESDPTEISDGFKVLEEFLCNLPLDDNKPSSTSAAAYAVPTNGNPFWMACNMVRNSCRRLSTHDIRNALLRHSSLIKK